MNEPRILVDDGSENFIGEGCFINELSNSEADPALSIARARVPPSATTRWHRLESIAERYLILEGEGVVEVGDLPGTEVGPGDVVLIPAGCRQRITNASRDVDLLFLAICTPAFQQENYQDLEEA